jgi:hypothetical protein
MIDVQLYPVSCTPHFVTITQDTRTNLAKPVAVEAPLTGRCTVAHFGDNEFPTCCVGLSPVCAVGQNSAGKLLSNLTTSQAVKRFGPRGRA